MNADELQNWLNEHADEICAFTDFEFIVGSPGDLYENLEMSWFRDPIWNEPQLGIRPIAPRTFLTRLRKP